MVAIREFTTKTPRAQRKHKEEKRREEGEAADNGLEFPCLLLSFLLCASFVLLVSLW
jgi:hypothetical protein